MSKPAVSRYMPQVPDGWVKCPRFGDPRFFDGLNIIPCKVPLSRRFDHLVGPSGRWTLADAITQFRGYGMEVATVIDLTKSRNYYDFGLEMEGLRGPLPNYVKIACRGRGEAPQPAEVNEALWHIFTHHLHPETQNKYILLHCTHGFNRTGFIIVSALMRLRKDGGINVRRAVGSFAASRPPGIYKDHYINELFKYYHETRDHARTLTPAVPAWKGNDDAEDAADAANEDEAGAQGAGEGDAGGAAAAAPVVHHEDIWSIGERVCPDEANWVRQQVCALLPFEGGGRGGGDTFRFPGMQPVSLSLERLGDLANHRYFVTWKADGTRYMMLIMTHGTYVMDRSFNVVRVEMRFNNGIKRPPPGHKPTYPVSKPMNLTLLDGEMVVDVDPEGRLPPRLRYLAYDACMINANPLVGKPWLERFRAIESDVVGPRNAERKYIDHWRHAEAQGRRWDPARSDFTSPPYAYSYNDEPFSVRQKPFWGVSAIDKVFARFHDPHKIGHESDGLILQGTGDLYVPGTCERLYKWKFAHMNSVDFLLRCATVPAPDGQGRVLDESAAEPLQLLLLDQAQTRGSRIAYVPVKKIDRAGHYRVEFPPGVDPLTYDGKLVECTFDRERGVWLYMRERKDKDTPNGSKVYLRIKESIVNHVDQDLLVGLLKEALLERPDVYGKDLSVLDPQQQAALRRDVEAWRAKMRERQEQQMRLQREQQQQQQKQQQRRPPHGAGAAAGDDDGGHGDDYGDNEHGNGHAHTASASPQGDHDGGGYRVSDAAPDEHGQGEGQEPDHGHEVQHRGPFLTRWPPEVLLDLPPECPAYEGVGFEPAGYSEVTGRRRGAESAA